MKTNNIIFIIELKSKKFMSIDAIFTFVKQKTNFSM